MKRTILFRGPACLLALAPAVVLSQTPLRHGLPANPVNTPQLFIPGQNPAPAANGPAAQTQTDQQEALAGNLLAAENSANQAELRLAQFAASRSQDPAVRNLAQSIADDSQSVVRTLQHPGLSAKTMTADTGNDFPGVDARLRKLTGAEFDAAMLRELQRVQAAKVTRLATALRLAENIAPSPAVDSPSPAGDAAVPVVSGTVQVIIPGRLPDPAGGTLPSVSGGALPVAIEGTLPNYAGGNLPSAIGEVPPAPIQGTLPNVAGGNLPNAMGQTLPSAITGPLPNYAGGNLPSVFGGAQRSITRGTLPGPAGGSLPNVSGGALSGINAGTLPGSQSGTQLPIDVFPRNNWSPPVFLTDPAPRFQPVTGPSVRIPSVPPRMR